MGHKFSRIKLLYGGFTVLCVWISRILFFNFSNCYEVIWTKLTSGNCDSSIPSLWGWSGGIKAVRYHSCMQNLQGINLKVNMSFFFFNLSIDICQNSSFKLSGTKDETLPPRLNHIWNVWNLLNYFIITLQGYFSLIL